MRKSTRGRRIIHIPHRKDFQKVKVNSIGDEKVDKDGNIKKYVNNRYKLIYKGDPIIAKKDKYLIIRTFKKIAILTKNVNFPHLAGRDTGLYVKVPDTEVLTLIHKKGDVIGFYKSTTKPYLIKQ